jgi:predicted SAM-dependent methyltransferase
MPPLHPQHLAIMGDLSEWTLVDKYIDHPDVKKWDAEVLDEVEDNSCDIIYSSHLLEHLSHTHIPAVLSLWKRKLKDGGRLIINVPDLAWVAGQILKYENGGFLEGVFNTFEGDRGLQSIVYGTHSHEGEYHKAGYTKSSITKLLTDAGFAFKDIKVEQFIDAHDFGILFVTCIK